MYMTMKIGLTRILVTIVENLVGQKNEEGLSGLT